MQAILFVTWFYYGQPPSSYQTAFGSMEACEVARAGILGDAQRLKDEADREVARLRSQGVIYNPAVPQVSVICSIR